MVDGWKSNAGGSAKSVGGGGTTPAGSKKGVKRTL